MFHVEHSQKKYCGERTVRGCAVAVVDVTTHQARPLSSGLQYVRHTSAGFDWGYLGSGPSQLAFALLLDHFGDPAPARLFYQSFKFEVVANFHRTCWELTTAEIAEKIANLQQRLDRREESA